MNKTRASKAAAPTPETMSTTQVIANYEALAALTGQMRELASRNDWDALIRIGEERGKLVAAVKPLDATARLDAAARHRKDELIEEILSRDAEIRTAAQAWMAQFQLDIKSSTQELRLMKGYGLQSAAAERLARDSQP